MSSVSDDAEINRLNNKIMKYYNTSINDYEKILGKLLDLKERIKDTLTKTEEKDKEAVRIDFGVVEGQIDIMTKQIDIIRTKINELNSLSRKPEQLKILREIDEGFTDTDSKYKGGRRNKPIYDTMTMKDVKELCKANQIKLSRVVNDKQVVYTKKELLTKLKRKKVI